MQPDVSTDPLLKPNKNRLGKYLKNSFVKDFLLGGISGIISKTAVAPV